MIRIGVFGANGRMGLALLEAATIKEQTQLTGAYVRSGSSLIGVNVNQINSAADKSVCFSDENTLESVDVLIDFTLPDGMRSHLKRAVEQSLPLVIGTTGLTADDMALLENAAKHIPIVFARNYSGGVNVLLNLVQTAATKFGDDLDIEIFKINGVFRGLIAPKGNYNLIIEFVSNDKNVELNTLLIPGQFPNYNRLIRDESEYSSIIKTNVEYLSSSLDRILTMANLHQPVVKFNFANESMIAAENAISRGEEVLDVDYSGSELSIAFNGRLLSEMLSNFSGDIQIYALGPQSPILIKGKDQDNLTGVVAPVKRS